MDRIFGRTISRHRASTRFDITPELTEKVEEMNLFEGFSVRRGTINIALQENLIFRWGAVIPKFRWKASGAYCGAQLHECILGCKDEDGKWEDCRAYLYDPDNPNDSYVNDLRKWEVLAETEFPHLRGRADDKQFEVRVRLRALE